MKQLINSRVAALMAVYKGVLWVKEQIKSTLAKQALLLNYLQVRMLLQMVLKSLLNEDQL